MAQQEKWTKVTCDVGCFIRLAEEDDSEDDGAECQVFPNKAKAKAAAKEHIKGEINNLKTMLDELKLV